MNEWVMLAWRNVLRNRRRTLMAAGVIAVGTVAILVAIGFVLATFHGLRELTIRSELGHMQISNSGEFEPFHETPMHHGLSPADTAALEEALRNMGDVRFTLRRVRFEGLVSNGRLTVPFSGQGVESEKEVRMASMFVPLLKGFGLPAAGDPDQMKVVLAVDLANILGVVPGDFVTLLSTTEASALNAIDVEVAGIYSTGVPDVDRRALMVPVPVAQSLLKTEKVSRLVVALGDTDRTDAVVGALRAAFPDKDIRSWAELTPFYWRVVTLYRNVFTIMGLIIGAVVLLSVSNTMLMSVMERVREVGTLMAIGIPRTRLRINFCLEGAMVGALGGLTGLAIAATLSAVLNYLQIPMPPPPGRTTSYPLIILMDFYAYGYVLSAMCILGAIAAWLPSRYIVRLKIVDALGHA